MKNSLVRPILRIVLPYVLFAGLWILLSDRLLGILLADPAALTRWSIYKGWAFVLVTAVLLSYLLKVELRARDITGRKRAEEALRQSEATLRSVFRAAPVGICIMKDRVFKSANKYWCEEFGYPEESIIGKNTRMFYESDEEWNRVGRELYAHLQARGVASAETRLRRSDGSFREVILTAAPIRQDDFSAGTVAIIHDITERKRAEEALRESNEKYRNLVEFSSDWIWQVDENGIYTYVGPHSRELLGYEPEEVIGKTPFDLMPLEERQRVGSIFAAYVARRAPFRALENTNLHKDGHLVVLETNGTPVIDERGIFRGYRGMDRDITERKSLEEQFRQAQKMESVGRLAGGVAHDFNNLLTIITGYGQLLVDRLGPVDPLRGWVDEIRKAGDRAASLTRQLLAFSRRQVLEPQVLDLNALVANMDKMLGRLVGEDIELVTFQEPGLGQVMADPGQVEQIIMNLAVNARDAMPQGGKLTIETANVDIDEAYARNHVPVTPGPYVMLAVSDTGCGMNAETQAHIFEPFFTTKEKGKGTGLGLAMVYGTVKQSGGYIWVYSEPGRGTAFKIHLPRIDQPVDVIVASRAGVVELPRGSETILLAEDEEAVRSFVKGVLESAGYEVLEAQGANDALRIGEEHKETLHLLLTDVVMPEMGGRQLAERVAPLHPETKVLYMSGYTDDAIVHHDVLAEGVMFLQKPFTPDALLRKVREVLGGHGEGNP